ncbi:hypothetical protein Max_44 [Enterococcus phage vB_EfaS_Max]|uniref:Uncharacterized protein n=2 Tax=Efquatrovirus TaxID=2560124 RepID=A0A139ZW17_9CAUD|nr:hypothetical protein CH14_gp22 [Enterococcus phage IME-EF4]YP_009303756.1 hypothetical protein BJD48_gp57 [Enterococcus phage Ec-ZZ2]AHB79823.1 hypothetical protein IME-EF4_22 [Enterococcus phage IME-EF4]AKG94459.1 hypothetical protein ZZ2_057 [Enterococcus phage Ec-ZZ2]QAX97299.1 hypothetical protein Max_44 [Enterococcus phage vB_EfaS_Max]
MNLLQAYEVVDSIYLLILDSAGKKALVVDTTDNGSVALLFETYEEETKVLNIAYNDRWNAIEVTVGVE